MQFPEDGKFKLKDDVLYTHYIVCGDPESAPLATESTPAPQPSPTNPSSSATPGWSIPRPWAPLNNLKVNPLNCSKNSRPVYSEATLKRTFPYVSLCLEHTGKNVTVESTIDSIYVKIPENSVCVSSILEEVAVRVGSAAEDLVILDAKFLPVSSDERCTYIAAILKSQPAIQHLEGFFKACIGVIIAKYMYVCNHAITLHFVSNILSCCFCDFCDIFLDLDYWKVPSRRFYIADQTELYKVQKMIKKGKKSILSRKRKCTLFDFTAEKGVYKSTYEQITSSIETVLVITIVYALTACNDFVTGCI